MRTLSALLLGSSMLFSAATQASSLSLTTTLASDYVADGVSATDSQPALQIGLDYEHDSGLYAGIWASNVDSDDHDTPNLELDYAIGYKHALTESIEGDVGITHYSYYHTDSGIDSDETNYQEWYAGPSRCWKTLLCITTTPTTAKYGMVCSAASSQNMCSPCLKNSR
jgi:uncharacterized protein (TIGR02001 family)